MKELEIGKSKIKVPFLGMGTWAIGGGNWWGNNDDEESVKAIHEAIEQGIVWIDTAPIYGLYHSELVVGDALKGKRDRVVLSTKCGLTWDHETPVKHKVVDGTQVYRDLSKAGILADVDKSLMRLKTDYIDVLFTHWQTTDFLLHPIEETMDAFQTLKKQGKIRAVGASNVTADIIREYCRYGQLDVIQEKYSLMTRRIETELLPVCKELGVSIQAYSPLEQGLLTGKIGIDEIYPAGHVRANNPQFAADRRRKAIELLKGWKDLEEKYDCSAGDLVIVLTSYMIDGLHILCGARKKEQVKENAGALRINLEEKDLIRMKKDVEEKL